MIVPFKPVEIGDVSVSFKRGSLVEFPESKDCAHKRLQLQEDGEILLCLDCDKQISAFWALARFSRQIDQWRDSLDRRTAAVKDAEKRQVVLRAAQVVETAWRRRKMVPVCPHCKHPITPTDGFGRINVRKLHTVDKPNP